MPVFECPQCGKQELIPLAFCDWMLDSLPEPRYDAEGSPIYTLKCTICASRKDNDSGASSSDRGAPGPP
jgi:hypothetical protein